MVSSYVIIMMFLDTVLVATQPLISLAVFYSTPKQLVIKRPGFPGGTLLAKGCTR